MLVFKAGTKCLCQKSKQGRHRSDCFFCHVCLGFCGWQLLFEILEHLRKLWLFGSYMSAHVLLNLLNELEQEIKYEAY